MRAAFLILVLTALALPAAAKDFSVEVRTERSFGYFVGDLVQALVEIRGPASAELTRASLPHPVPLTISLDLRDVSVDERDESQKRVWLIRVTYQNFYAALDVRNLEVPGFKVSFRSAGEPQVVDVPAWRFGVAPLREITPEQKERGADYLRPDPAADFVDEFQILRNATMLALLCAIFLIAVAWDRGWPPFHHRPARAFALSARKLSALARAPKGGDSLRVAVRDLHRAFDLAAGKSLLRPDLEDFFCRRPEFAGLRATTDRFFAASEHMFFGAGESGGTSAFTLSELVAFARALAKSERAE